MHRGTLRWQQTTDSWHDATNPYNHEGSDHFRRICYFGLAGRGGGDEGAARRGRNKCGLHGRLIYVREMRPRARDEAT